MIGIILSAILLMLVPTIGFAAPESDGPVQSDTGALEHRTVDTGDDVISIVEDIPVSVGNLNELGDLLNDARSAVRNKSTVYSTDYYGSQLPQSAYSIYNAIKSSELWNGPTTTRVDLMSCLSADERTVTGTIIAVGNEDGDPKFSCESGSVTFTNMVHAAATALIYDHPELSWLVNTDASAQYGFNFVPTAADQDAIESLSSGDIYTLECNELIVPHETK